MMSGLEVVSIVRIVGMRRIMNKRTQRLELVGTIQPGQKQFPNRPLLFKARSRIKLCPMINNFIYERGNS